MHGGRARSHMDTRQRTARAFPIEGEFCSRVRSLARKGCSAYRDGVQTHLAALAHNELLTPSPEARRTRARSRISTAPVAQQPQFIFGTHLPLRKNPSISHINGRQKRRACKVCKNKTSFYCSACATESKCFPVCGVERLECLTQHLMTCVGHQ